MKTPVPQWPAAILTGGSAVGMVLLVAGLVGAATWLQHGPADQRSTGMGMVGLGCALGLGIIAAAVVLR